MKRDPELLVQSSPFLATSLTTPALMRWVLLLAMLPLLAAVLFFGLSAVLVVGSATLGAVLTERWLGPKDAPKDGTAVLTGVLLGLTLPPGLPMWMAFLGGVAGVGLGKLVWGGLGQNLFNPALIGRAFLQAAFPTAITTWATPRGPLGEIPGIGLVSSNFALPFSNYSPVPAQVDAVAGATPLNYMKFEQVATSAQTLFWGTTSGSLGETSALVLLVCGLLMCLGSKWLRMPPLADWRIPVSILVTVAALSSLLPYLGKPAFGPVSMLLSGGLLFGAVFMATDPVTSPMSPKGTWAFGIGIGALIVLIRAWGGLPEGVMYAILLMNAATPHIERYFEPRPFGRNP